MSTGFDSVKRGLLEAIAHNPNSVIEVLAA